MPVIDHKERRERIVRRSVKLFASVGFKDVTYQMIAEHCGVSRTVLYRYFTDKTQIFHAAIREVVGRVVRKHAEIMHMRETSAAERIHQISRAALDSLFDNPEFLTVVMEVVTDVQRAGHDLSRKILGHTIGLKRVFQTLLSEGIESGEFRRDASASLYTDLLYTQFESALMRLTVSHDASYADTLGRIEEILRRLKK